MIIDSHNHLTDDFNIDNAPSYFKQLESRGVDKIMICAVNHKIWGGNEAVKKFMDSFPEKIIGFSYIDIEKDNHEDIYKYKEQGFKGLKIIETTNPYDHNAYMKYYETASKLEMPILFHMGFLGIRPGRFVNCNNYRPITLDTIARRFPDLRMICAHMGNPWWDEGFLVMWKHKNIYCDMSGLSACRRDLSFWHKLFKPNNELHEAVFKLIFASDQFMFGSKKYDDYYIKYYEKLFSLLNLDQEKRNFIMYNNFFNIINGNQ
ncbi:MAG: amidohydrolase family protein [bacterium]